MSERGIYGRYYEHLSSFVDSLEDRERDTVITLTESEDKAYMSRSLDRFPQSFNSIDWSQVEVRFVRENTDSLEIANVLAEGVETFCRPQDDVVVFWGDAGTPSLRLPASVVKKYAQQLVDLCFDSYYFLVDESVVIEAYHEGRVTIADIPSVES